MRASIARLQRGRPHVAAAGADRVDVEQAPLLVLVGAAVVVAYGRTRRRVGARAICAAAAVIGAATVGALIVVGTPYTAYGLDCGAAFRDPEPKLRHPDGDIGPGDAWFDECLHGARARRTIAVVVLVGSTVPAFAVGAAVEDTERRAHRRRGQTAAWSSAPSST
jgi:hypothetical protein